MRSWHNSLKSRLLVIFALNILVLTLVSCQPVVSLGFNIETLSLKDQITEIKMFVFDGEGESVDCERFDPVGRPAGDASVRTGQSALYTLSAAIDDANWEVSDLASGRYVFIFEGWQNGIEDNRSFATLLGYALSLIHI